MVAVLMALSINGQFAKVIKNPSTILFTAGGDGIKNYLTPMLHVKNSTSYNHFDSMNYPYGEHVLFTDNQPLISNILRFIQQNITDISENTIGVLNYAMLISLFLSGILLYYIFRRLDLPHYYSMIAGVSVVWLSPQVIRFAGHYGLSYMLVLLLLLYFLMEFEKRENKWSYRILALVLLSPMLHFYNFGIAALFLTLFYALKVINDKSSLVFYAKHWALQIIVPFVFFTFIWLKIGNSVTDRPDSPLGFLYYVTVWEGTFFSPGNWMYDFIDQYVVKIKKVNENESINYVGFVATFFFFVRLLSWIFSRKIKMLEEEMMAQLPEKNFLRTAFWASFLLYLFSIGIPFNIPGVEVLLDYTGPLKQFRGLGRFSWIFFFVLNIVAFYAVYQWGSRIKSIEFQRLFYFIFLTIIVSEGIRNARKVNPTETMASTYAANEESLETWISHIEKDKYQALLPIPYFHLGSEFLGFDPDGTTIANHLLTSYHTKIPTLGVMMSRTSWQQTLGSVPFGRELYREPPVLKNLPNQKPLLVMESKAHHKRTDFVYQNILDQGRKIHENKEYALYELPIDAYQKAIAVKNQKIRTEAQDPKLVKNGIFLTKDSVFNCIYDSFDANISELHYRGNGAMPVLNKEKKIIFTGQIPNQQKGKRYSLQCWLHAPVGINLQTDIYIVEKNKNTGETIKKNHHGALHNVVTLDGSWFFLSMPFDVQNDDSIIEVMFFNKNSQAKNICIDEFMIVPEWRDFYQINGNEVMKNGRWYGN